MNIIILYGIIFVLTVSIIVLAVKYVCLRLKYNSFLKYLYNYLNTIISARYGNLNSKCEEGFNDLTSQLSKNTNALMESINDRDKMIKEYIEKEKQSQNLKQDFISSLAHDLKVPIIAQDNTYDLFLDNKFGEISSVQRNAIENLKISNNDLKNLVLDLLDAHKMETNEITLQKTDCNIVQFIEELIEQNKSILLIQNKKINFITDEKELSIKIDKLVFKRILNNLISNAVFYGKNSPEIDIELNKDEKNLNISIIDYGEGIKEENLSKIFSKYYTSAKKYSKIGVGLGLYIVNKLVLAHGGTLSVKNSPSKGACFTVSIPIN